MNAFEKENNLYLVKEISETLFEIQNSIDYIRDNLSKISCNEE